MAEEEKSSYSQEYEYQEENGDSSYPEEEEKDEKEKKEEEDYYYRNLSIYKNSDNQELLTMIKEVYKEIIASDKTKITNIQKFKKLNYNIWSEAFSMCNLPGCGCVSKPNVFQWINATSEINDNVPCTPKMYDFIIEQGLADKDDIKFIAKLFDETCHNSRIALMDHISQVCDMKEIVQYRYDTDNSTLLHKLLLFCYGSNCNETIIINIMKRFVDNGFDLKTKTWTCDDVNYEHIINNTDNGRSLLDIAVSHMLPKVIEYLVSNGLKFENSYKSNDIGIKIKSIENNEIKRHGADPVQSLINKVYLDLVEKPNYSIFYDVNSFNRANNSTERSNAIKKFVEEQTVTRNRHSSELKKQTIQQVYNTIVACCKAGYTIKLNDAHGYNIIDYIYRFLYSDLSLVEKFASIFI